MDTVSKETLESGETVNTDPRATLEFSEADIEMNDKLSCDLCNHKSQTKGGLQVHIGRKTRRFHS